MLMSFLWYWFYMTFNQTNRILKPVQCKKMLTFAEHLDKAHKVGGFARAQDLTQGPDVVLCKAQCLNLWQFLCFGVTRDNLPETLQSII